LNRCVSLLRRKLGDDSRNPTYIQNIPRLGYRLMMPIQVPSAASPPVEGTTARNRGWTVRVAGATALVAAVALVADLEAEGGLLRYQFMALWAVLGEADRAFATAMSINGIGQDFETVLEVMFSDDLRNLRRHSDFQKLLESTGLTAYWSQAGCVWTDDRVRCD
jgi:hypothetical protein